MPLLDNNNKFLWYIILLLSLFIIVLFTRTQVMNLQVNLEEVDLNESLLQEQREESLKIEEIKNNLDEDNKEIDKYLIEVNEDEIIDYIYSEIEVENLNWNWLVEIRNISISEWLVNEMWFRESLVTLNLRVSSEEILLKVLDFFASDDSKYKFFIDSFSYPNMESESSFNTTLPLKIFYK